MELNYMAVFLGPSSCPLPRSERFRDTLWSAASQRRADTSTRARRLGWRVRGDELSPSPSHGCRGMRTAASDWGARRPVDRGRKANAAMQLRLWGPHVTCTLFHCLYMHLQLDYLYITRLTSSPLLFILFFNKYLIYSKLDKSKSKPNIII